MTCPTPIAELMLEIIQVGILNARSAGWSANAERAAAEADHFHNLPDLLIEYLPNKLEYYWRVERPSYIRHCALLGFPTTLFEAIWKRLSDVMLPLTSSSAVA